MRSFSCLHFGLLWECSLPTLASTSLFPFSTWVFSFSFVSLSLSLSLAILLPPHSSTKAHALWKLSFVFFLQSFTGLLEAISGGVFLYISTFHLLAEELANPRYRSAKLVLFTGMNMKGREERERGKTIPMSTHERFRKCFLLVCHDTFDRVFASFSIVSL